MVNSIALKFFNYIKDAGPCESGDRYRQDLIDEVWDAIGGYISMPIPLTEEEQEYLDNLDNFDELEALIEGYLTA